MKKMPIVFGFLTAFLCGIAVAQEQEQQSEGVDVDQIVAACEDKFDPKNYQDENERNQLIEDCIETQLNASKSKGEEG